MALKDITSLKDLYAERDRNQAKIKQDREDARAAQQEELKRADYAKERRIGNNIAYQQFKNSGTEGIDTEPNLIDRVMGASKDDAKYQAAREMKSALENERARANVPNTLDEVRSSGETKLKKGGAVKAKKMASGGKVSRSSASKRADGIAQKGHTKGKYL
jgi:hypothetical protein